MNHLTKVFQPLWILLQLIVQCSRPVCVFCVRLWFVASFSVWGLVVLGCDVETGTLNEEYLLKQHRIIEAVPRALNREHSQQISTSLVTANSAKILLDPCSEQKSYEAIRTLHRQLDDDADGDIDVAESDEFIRDELKYENVYERHREFHENDKYINVDELWQAWKISQVHNWTVQETVEWLVSYVELPQYEHTFRNNAVDGTCLPRMAINSNSLLSVKLGIKDPIHRQKIALKAMDVVLFGAPLSHNYLKDAILAVSLIIAVGGCWFAYVQHRYSQKQMQKMMRDMEVLQKAEEALLDMQEQLNKARQAQEIVNIEKQDLERRLQDEMKTSTKHSHSHTHSKSVGGSEGNRVRELEEQLRSAKSSLHEAERRLDSQPWVGPPSLQHWLQLTHELELRNYNNKKAIAEQQLQAAKEGCEKLRKKRSSFMGTFRIAHGGSIDDVDDCIIQAKTALAEVTSDLQERMHRWKQIEKFCGFPIVQNPGFAYLESLLKPPVMNGAAGVASFTRSSSEGNLRDEQPPPYAAGISAVQQLVHNSASMFSVPVRPSWNTCSKQTEPGVKKRRYLHHQDSGISLTSLVHVPVNCTPKNGTLMNIPPPPPKYSKSSPSYNRKITVITSENSRSTPQAVSAIRTAPNTQCMDMLYQDILEVTGEEDDQLFELDEDDRSTTPQSCSSYSGYSEAGRTQCLAGDGSQGAQLIVGDETLKNDIRELAECTDKLVPLKESIKTITTDASGDEKRKRKPSSQIVAAFKSSFSNSNLSKHDETSSESTCSVVDAKHKKKKKLFPTLRHKKEKKL